ncbi:hypothetical protein N8I77_004697 [Diaporthe amygdali]|uniref:HMG box domain-containing protein n=1 Tax=Phomopsis amygdali TaxID=1214568 RepID=A0AAD9W8W3_PHOAM|nr:hypothetical protein N8I77_004697 [Diaporthe amygdali]
MATFPREQNSAEATSLHSSSYPPSRLSSPAPQAGMSPHLGQHAVQQYAPPGTYNPQFFQPAYGHDGSAYPSLPEEPVQPGYTTPASSPSQRSDVISLRNGSVPRSSSMRPLASKSRSDRPQTKKARAKAARKTPKITEPLSESTKHLSVPMIDIEAYVNRSEAERKAEVENSKTPGKIKRPMNAFMLYRKAYQGRTKEHCTQNNHQLVSQVCGDSWPLEPEHIRNKFTEWARIERENHAKTWPEYKFAPKKPKDLKRKAEEEEGDEELPLEDYDHETGRLIKRPRSNRTTPVPEADHVYAHQVPYYTQYSPQQSGMIVPGRAQIQMSSYEYTNPNKPMPAPYNHMSFQQQSHYLSSQAMPTRNQQLRSFGVEDVAFHKTASPGNPYHSPQQTLMDQYTTAPPPQQHMEQTAHAPDQMFDPQFAASFGNLGGVLYQAAGDGSFDHNNPLLLEPNSIEHFVMDGQASQVTSEGFALGGTSTSLDGQQLDEQLRGLLQGSGSSDWQVQPISDGQGESHYETDWSAMDPSLSEPYNAQD